MTEQEQIGGTTERLIDDHDFDNPEMQRAVCILNAAHHLHKLRKDADMEKEGDSYESRDHVYLFTMEELISADTRLRFPEEKGGIRRIIGHAHAQEAVGILIETGMLASRINPEAEGHHREQFYEYIEDPPPSKSQE